MNDEEPPTKVRRIDDIMTAASPKQISELPLLFLEQILRHLDIKSLFVIVAVSRTFHQSVLVVLSKVTRLAIRQHRHDSKLDINLLPGHSILLDTLCSFKQHWFPKKNILTLNTDNNGNEQIVVNILKTVPILVALHLQVNFSLRPVSTSEESILNFILCASLNHTQKCNHYRLPPSEIDWQQLRIATRSHEDTRSSC